MKITASEISLVGAALVTLLFLVVISSFPVWDVDVSRESILTPLRVVIIALIVTLFLVKIPIELQDRPMGLAVALFGLGLAVLLLMSVAGDIIGTGGELSLAWFIMAPLLIFIVVIMIGLALRRSGSNATTARSILALISMLVLASTALMLLSTVFFVGLATLLLLVYCLRNVTPSTPRRPTQ